jgi:hypothetical protein
MIMQETRLGRHGFFHSHQNRDELERWFGREPWREKIGLAFKEGKVMQRTGAEEHSTLFPHPNWAEVEKWLERESTRNRIRDALGVLGFMVVFALFIYMLLHTV